MVFSRIRSLINPFHKLNKKNKKSQIAVVITLTIAIIIVLILVLINIYRVSLMKTMLSQAADSGALQLASQFGSMSADMAKKAKCDFNWGAVTFFVGAILMIVSLAFFFPMAGVFWTLMLTGLGASVAGWEMMSISSANLNKKINQYFFDLGTLNGLRESTLFAELNSIQTDDNLLRPSGGGFFYADNNYNKTKDPGEPEYDLSDEQAYRVAPQVGRFAAWYYTRRLSLIGAKEIRKEVSDFMGQLKLYIDFDNWDSTKWKYKNASLVVEPTASGEDGSWIKVTCLAGSCPSWVKNITPARISILTIDEDNKVEDAVYSLGANSGFLNDKFLSLADSLHHDFGLFFSGGGDGKYDVKKVRDDLLYLLGYAKFLQDLPVSLRIQSVGQWLPTFYDLKFDHTAIRDIGTFDHDIFDRLTRDSQIIQEWIFEHGHVDNLKDIDAKIRGEINPELDPDNPETYCEQGRGNLVIDCAEKPKWCCYETLKPCCCQEITTDSDGNESLLCVGDHCTDLRQVRWYGAYGTCAEGSGSPRSVKGFNHYGNPVCIDGDLYSSIPEWCGDLRVVDYCVSAKTPCKNSGDCHSDPACQPKCDDGKGCNCCKYPDGVDTKTKSNKAYRFQGQFSWENKDPIFPSAFTEVQQAIEILAALKKDIDELKWEIENFAKGIAPYLNVDDRFKEQVVYAWRGRDGRGHLVRAKVEGHRYGEDGCAIIENYPGELPRLHKTTKNWGFKICASLQYGKGNFTVKLWRYDEARQVGPWWNFRYTKPPQGGVDYKADLDYLIGNIQNTQVSFPDYKNNMLALFTSTELDDICNIAVHSWTKAAYGPEKKDIKILCTDGDEKACPVEQACPP